MVHMGGESWRAIKDLKAPFPDLKAGHVDHLLTVYIFLSCVCFYCTAVYCLFFYVYLFSYFSKLLNLRFLTHYSIHLCFKAVEAEKTFLIHYMFYSHLFF